MKIILILSFLISALNLGAQNLSEGIKGDENPLNRYYDAYLLMWNTNFGYIYPPRMRPIEKQLYISRNRIKKIITSYYYPSRDSLISICNFSISDTSTCNLISHVEESFDQQGRPLYTESRDTPDYGNDSVIIRHEFNDKIINVYINNKTDIYYFNSKHLLDSNIYISYTEDNLKDTIKYYYKYNEIGLLNDFFIKNKTESKSIASFSYEYKGGNIEVNKFEEYGKQNKIFIYDTISYKLRTVKDIKKNKRLDFFYNRNNLYRITINKNETIETEMFFLYDDKGNLTDYYSIQDLDDENYGNYIYEEYLYNEKSLHEVTFGHYRNSSKLWYLTVIEYEFY